MSTLSKIALGLVGHLTHPAPPPAPVGMAPIALPPPRHGPGAPGNVGLLDALSRRCSRRGFRPEPLAPAVLSELLWAAAGINRPAEHGRTAPSALNAQEVQVYAAMAGGLYRYLPDTHMLQPVTPADVRRVTGYQDFVDTAPLDLVYVADHGRMSMVPAAQRQAYAFAAAGAMAQNVYLYAAAAGLGTVLRAWFDHHGLGAAMGLGADQALLLAQTVGWPDEAAEAALAPAGDRAALAAT